MQELNSENRKKEELNKEITAVLNKFASIASHDLKNPLSSIKNIAYYFNHSVKLVGEVPNKMLRMLNSEVERMNKMIEELLDSTRVKQLAPVKSNLDILVKEVIENNKQDNVIFDTDIEELKSNVDPGRFKQVISSIIKNSKEAMPEGGTINIKIFRSENNAVIEITDTGKGMDAATLEKAFDPMFSTKSAKALGMSLTVSKQIINMHGGSISAESSLGKGTKFTIKLPIAA